MELFEILLILAVSSSISCQNLPLTFSVRSTQAGVTDGVCPVAGQELSQLRESIKQEIRSLINDTVLPILLNQTQAEDKEDIERPCDCGGPGWRSVVYLNMSDTTQTCPPNWQLITTPRRSCGRPANASTATCFSAFFPTQSTSYSQVCGRVIGYQFGQPQAFVLENLGSSPSIDSYYVDGASLTYGTPRQHIWSFAVPLSEITQGDGGCPCTTLNNDYNIVTPPYVGNDYFCETGVPPGRPWSLKFYEDDPLWDGQGCGSTTCCSFNNPPWFCKQLSQSSSDDLEMRLCGVHDASLENTPLELVEIYVK